MIWIILNAPDVEITETQLIRAELDSRQMDYQLMFLGNISYVCKDNTIEFYYQGKAVELPSLCINRTGASGNSQWHLICVLSSLESSGVKCINSSYIVENFGNKFKTAHALQRSSLSAPDFYIYKTIADIPVVMENFKFPLIAKTFYGSFGHGVQLCQTPDDFTNLSKFITTCANAPLLVQEYIDYQVGQDVRVLVVDNKIAGAMQRTAPSSYKSNLTGTNAYATPYAIDAQLDDFCRKIFTCFQFDMVGIDLLIDRDGFKICEININPGFQNYNKFCNSSFEKNLVDFIESLT